MMRVEARFLDLLAASWVVPIRRLSPMFRRVESRHGNHRNAIASLTRLANQIVAAEDRHTNIRYYDIPSVLF